jgi:NADH/NAD ratio-sensing transcriptional regulator Rex
LPNFQAITTNTIAVAAILSPKYCKGRQMLSFASISETEMRLARQTDLITSDVGQFVIDCIVVHNHWVNVDIEKVDCEEVILSVDLHVVYDEAW